MAFHLKVLPQNWSSTTLLRQSQARPGRAFGDGGRVSFHVRWHEGSRTSMPVDVVRQSPNLYRPSIWSNDFVASLKSDYTVENYEEWAKSLKDKVRKMLDVDGDGVEPLETLELIDKIQRLGVGYHFEKEINRALNSISSSKENQLDAEKSLHATALRFRLLRQHGYEVSQDVIKSFKNKMGNFQSCLANDVKGMLSLYEASYLAFEEDDLLHEAKIFTREHLKGIIGNIEMDLTEEVSHALELPLHQRMLRLEARSYIEAYSKRSDTNLQLLELAKLDFNMVQSTYQRDLIEMSRWWKDMGFGNQLNFARDRLVECFFWAVGIIFEPHLSHCRIALAKIAALVTVIDDIYDVYGSLDELELFTDVVERWDVRSMQELPEHMKLCFLALYNTINQMAYDTLKEHRLDSLPYLKQAWTDLLKSFLQEAKWNYNKQIPMSKDYLANAWISVSGAVFLAHAYFLLGENLTKETVECLESYPSITRQSSMIFRLCNDLAELDQSESINIVSCHMHETGVSEEVARYHVKHLIDEMWKEMNKDGVNCNNFPFPKSFAEVAINLARISHCTYQYGDAHSAPDHKAKERIVSVLATPLHLRNIKDG